jgi:CHAT domain-containing protein
MDSRATKQALLRLSAPGILHIATHGFFLEQASSTPRSLPTPQALPDQATRKVGSTGALAARMPKCPPEEPLLCSGLVLAGAGASEPASVSRRIEESWVTALELAGLNLWGTQLVVLSACDTGRGEIQLGQSVAGLRRAFLEAGSETLVSSLWRVDDKITRQLMEGYYRHLLAGQGRSAALREAMKELRHEQPHPHFWAPFIALGLDAPLQGFDALQK